MYEIFSYLNVLYIKILKIMKMVGCNGTSVKRDAVIFNPARNIAPVTKWTVIKYFVLFGLLKARSEMSHEKCRNNRSTF